MKTLLTSLVLILILAGCATTPPPAPIPAPSILWDQQPVNRDAAFAENDLDTLNAVRSHLSEEPQWFALTTRLSNVGLLNIAYTSCARDDDIEAKRAVMRMVLPDPADVAVYEEIRQVSTRVLCPAE